MYLKFMPQFASNMNVGSVTALVVDNERKVLYLIEESSIEVRTQCNVR